MSATRAAYAETLCGRWQQGEDDEASLGYDGSGVDGFTIICESGIKGRGHVLANADVVAFIGATDPARAKGFYQDKLGLRLTSEEPFHALVFDAGGTMLRVLDVNVASVVCGYSMSA